MKEVTQEECKVCGYQVERREGRRAFTSGKEQQRASFLGANVVIESEDEVEYGGFVYGDFA